MDFFFDKNPEVNKANLSEIISLFPLIKQNEIFKLILNYTNDLNKIFKKNVQRIAALEETSEFDDL